MNNRERALNILNFKAADRMPAVHFGYWWELLLEWEEQGHIPKEVIWAWADGNDADREIDKLLGWDFNWCTCKSANDGLFPKFESKLIELLPDGFKRMQNEDGLIVRTRDGAGSIPGEDDYLLKDRAAFEEFYKPKMQFCDERVDLQSFKNISPPSERTCPIGLNVGSIFGKIRDMCSLVGLSYLMADDYDLVCEIVDTYAEMQYKVYEKILSSGVQFDFAHYWEDICFNNGPLLSPTMFEEMCFKHYVKRNKLMREHGIKIISLDCDGVTTMLLPTWFKAGVNTMFPIEIGTWGDQFATARLKYGSEMRGVGGMDKTAFRKDKAAVDSELKRLEPLIKLGGFIPCPDHRVMPGSKWELVQYYTDKIKKMQL